MRQERKDSPPDEEGTVARSAVGEVKHKQFVESRRYFSCMTFPPSLRSGVSSSAQLSKLDRIGSKAVVLLKDSGICAFRGNDTSKGYPN
jgi:hypothetical protein